MEFNCVSIIIYIGAVKMKTLSVYNLYKSSEKMDPLKIAPPFPFSHYLSFPSFPFPAINNSYIQIDWRSCYK